MSETTGVFFAYFVALFGTSPDAAGHPVWSEWLTEKSWPVLRSALDAIEKRPDWKKYRRLPTLRDVEDEYNRTLRGGKIPLADWSALAPCEDCDGGRVTLIGGNPPFRDNRGRPEPWDASVGFVANAEMIVEFGPCACPRGLAVGKGASQGYRNFIGGRSWGPDVLEVKDFARAYARVCFLLVQSGGKWEGYELMAALKEFRSLAGAMLTFPCERTRMLAAAFAN